MQLVMIGRREHRHAASLGDFDVVSDTMLDFTSKMET